LRSLSAKTKYKQKSRYLLQGYTFLLADPVYY
jgi:hypothetical protein